MREQLPLTEAENRASSPTPSATVAAPTEGLPWIAILLVTTGGGLAVLLATRLVGVTRRTGHMALVASPAATAPLAAAVRDRPLCEIHWESDEDGSWFVAATTDDDEHAILAASSTFAWFGADPPSRTPEARAALHGLTRHLQAAGWRSVHGHGRQHGELRWYAQRFLAPAD